MLDIDCNTTWAGVKIFISSYGPSIWTTAILRSSTLRPGWIDRRSRTEGDSTPRTMGYIHGWAYCHQNICKMNSRALNKPVRAWAWSGTWGAGWSVDVTKWQLCVSPRTFHMRNALWFTMILEKTLHSLVWPICQGFTKSTVLNVYTMLTEYALVNTLHNGQMVDELLCDFSQGLTCPLSSALQ